MTTVAPGLPRTLVRLKLRLIRNRARSSSGGVAKLLVSLVTALILGLVGAVVAFGCGQSTHPRVARTAIIVGATVLTLGWTVLPLLTFSSDETLDPARLVLFPLRRGPLMRGLLAASFVGPAPAMVIIVTAGAVLGYASGVGTVIVVAALGVLLLFSAACARTLSTVLSAGLSSRRGRDAMVIVISMLALAFQLVRFIRFSSVDPHVVDRVDDVLRWLPPGMLGQAVLDARGGRYGRALLEMVPAVALLPLLIAVWSRALAHASTVMSGGETSRAHGGDESRAMPLLFPRLPFLALRPWGAVTAKELRYVGREPRRKVNLINSLLVGVGVPIWIAVRSHGQIGSGVVLLAALAGYVAVLGSSNQFGLDGPAMWLDVIAGDTTRDVLIGKNVATVVLVLPIVTAVGLGLAVVTGGWVYVPAVVVMALAGLGAGLGTADVISVHFPIRLPESRSPFAGSGGGQGCATGAILLACVLAQNVLLAPVAILATVSALFGPVWLLATVPICLAYGATLWWIGLGLATTWGRDHLPELLVKVNPARSD